MKSEGKMINEKQLDKFLKICEESGFDLSREEALANAIQLVNLVRAVYKPMTKDELETTQQRREETKEVPSLEEQIFGNRYKGWSERGIMFMDTVIFSGSLPFEGNPVQ